MSLTYSTIAWSASVHKGVQQNVEYGYKSSTTAGTVFDFFTGLGDVAFAYAGHIVVLEIQATIPSTPDKPSKGPMWKGVLVAYFVVALCYFPVALICYQMFGNTVEDNILISLEKPAWLIAAVNMFVVIHVIGSYQEFAMPVFDIIESLLVKILCFKPSMTLRFITRDIYVAFTMFVGITFPFLWWSTRIFWRICLCPNNLLFPLCDVACHLQTKEVQLILVCQLDLHRPWSTVDDIITYRRAKEYHKASQRLQILQFIIFQDHEEASCCKTRKGIEEDKDAMMSTDRLRTR